MVTFRRLGFHHHFPLQHLLFGGADFGITDHATFEQQVARRRANPGIDGDWRIAFAGPGDDPAHAFELFMHVLNGGNGGGKQLPEGPGDRLGARVLDQIGFTGLGDQG